MATVKEAWAQVDRWMDEGRDTDAICLADQLVGHGLHAVDLKASIPVLVKMDRRHGGGFQIQVKATPAGLQFFQTVMQ